ncbi:uncharacterized protein LOC123314831 [Coccinella septempunctata]|uniref:uncharacterized protein LOC123314831 n=1 Tax=Coccinella septempunctata TaxID=41139 RepID=UPI001D06A862|nr:uncharacterized protein LOC123314831 [Coccinella septempunctata]
MTGKYFLVIIVSLFFSQFLECEAQQGAIEKLFTLSVKAVNLTNTKFHSGFNSIVDGMFKPLEVIGTTAEDGVVAGTKYFGKMVNFVGKQVKTVAKKLQTGEEKFVGCVKSEQFDPVKKIFLDVSSCVTGKSDTVSKIVQNSLVQVNSTYGIVKSLTALPQCQGAKCFADYTSGIMGKFGSIALGLGSIGKDLTTGVVSIPITLPTCLISKPAMSPVKIFGLLGVNIMKCFQSG